MCMVESIFGRFEGFNDMTLFSYGIHNSCIFDLLIDDSQKGMALILDEDGVSRMDLSNKSLQTIITWSNSSFSA